MFIFKTTKLRRQLLHFIYTGCLQNTRREDDHNIILRKYREVQGYSFQNISTQVNKFQPKQKGFP
jgi:hypothetical protein